MNVNGFKVAGDDQVHKYRYPSLADIPNKNGSSIWTVDAENAHNGLIRISDLRGRTDLTPAKDDLILDGNWNIYRIDLVGNSTVSATKFGNMGEIESDSDIFRVSYEVTTGDEIHEAVSAGKVCILLYAFPEKVYFLTWCGFDTILGPSGTVIEKSAVFTAIDGDEKTTIRVSGSTWFSPSTVKYARSASPTFTGTPKAPTAASGTNTTQIATTAFVRREINSLVTDTASGVVASFPDGIDNIPVKDLTVAIEPVQSGSGDPSQSNIRPISGWTGVEVTRTGKNLLPPKSTDETLSGVTWHINEDGSVLVSGTASGNSIVDFGRGELTLEPGTYTTNLKKDKVVCAIWENSSPAKLIDGAGGTFTLANKTPVFIRFYVPSGETVNTTIFPQLELGSTATAYEPYQSATYEITFPSAAGTVYGGTLDVTTGKLRVTHGHIASYAGETLSGEWLSDRDVYSAGATPTNGAQVVYTLATPVVYDLTPTEVRTLLGTNNIWADCGDSTVEYRADTKLYIDKKIAAS